MEHLLLFLIGLEIGPIDQSSDHPVIPDSYACSIAGLLLVSRFYQPVGLVSNTIKNNKKCSTGLSVHVLQA